MSKNKIYVAIVYRYYGDETERRYFSSKNKAHKWFKELGMKELDGIWQSADTHSRHNQIEAEVHKEVVDKVD